MPLQLAETNTAANDAARASAEDLQRLVEAAIVRWGATGLGTSVMDRLRQVDVQLVNLPDRLLGLAYPDRVLIDLDAAGAGWFVDESPLDDGEFVATADGLRSANHPAAGHIDLLTVLMHEFGHVLGLGDQDSQKLSLDVMADELKDGSRRLISAEDAEAVFSLGL